MATRAQNAAHLPTTLPTYVSYNAEEKQWTYDGANAFTLSSLQQFVSTQFNIKQFELTYTDRDGRPQRIVTQNNRHEKRKSSLKQSEASARKESRNKLQISVNDEVSRPFPLCEFTTNDLCGTIKQSFHTHPAYKKNIALMETMFTEHELAGEKWIQSIEIPKTIKHQMLKIMTEMTFNIMLQSFHDEWNH
eukprot:806375_1